MLAPPGEARRTLPPSYCASPAGQRGRDGTTGRVSLDLAWDAGWDAGHAAGAEDGEERAEQARLEREALDELYSGRLPPLRNMFVRLHASLAEARAHKVRLQAELATVRAELAAARGGGAGGVGGGSGGDGGDGSGGDAGCRPVAHNYHGSAPSTSAAARADSYAEGFTAGYEACGRDGAQQLDAEREAAEKRAFESGLEEGYAKGYDAGVGEGRAGAERAILEAVRASLYDTGSSEAGAPRAAGAVGASLGAA